MIAHPTPETVADKIAIQEVLNDLVMAADERDWERLALRFADNVEIAYHTTADPDASVEPPVVRPAKDIIADWTSLFAHTRGTQHSLTNQVIEVDGDTATSKAYVTSFHVALPRLNADQWHQTFGAYRHKYQKIDGVWRVTSMIYKQLYAVGNPSFFPH
ncbi:MAG: nuclear transport factor 2 family protein [Pseudomonadota bacterium]